MYWILDVIVPINQHIFYHINLSTNWVDNFRPKEVIQSAWNDSQFLFLLL
jgi:hypothetical protein